MQSHLHTGCQSSVQTPKIQVNQGVIIVIQPPQKTGILDPDAASFSWAAGWRRFADSQFWPRDWEPMETHAAALPWQEQLIQTGDRAAFAGSDDVLRRCITATHTHTHRGSKVAPAPFLSIFWDYVPSELLYNFWHLWRFKLSSAVFAPKAVLTVRSHLTAEHTQTHAHTHARRHADNRSVSKLISLAQFDRSLHLAAS